MYFNDLIKTIEDYNDNIDVVMAYSKLLDILVKIKKSVEFPETDDEFINKIHKSVELEVKDVINKRILEIRDIISRHIQPKYVISMTDSDGVDKIKSVDVLFDKVENKDIAKSDNKPDNKLKKFTFK